MEFPMGPLLVMMIHSQTLSLDYQLPKYASEKAMAPHSSALAWKIPWTEEPGRLQSMGLQRLGRD